MPHLGQEPFVAGFPFFSLTFFASFISTDFLHFTQYALTKFTTNPVSCCTNINYHCVFEGKTRVSRSVTPVLSSRLGNSPMAGQDRKRYKRVCAGAVTPRTCMLSDWMDLETPSIGPGITRSICRPQRISRPFCACRGRPVEPFPAAFALLNSRFCLESLSYTSLKAKL